MGGDPIDAPTSYKLWQLAKDFPRVSTVRYHLYRMNDYRAFTVINEVFTIASLLVSDCEAKPTAAFVDSRNVETTESGTVSV